MKNLQYNLQIRQINNRKHWEDIKPVTKTYKDWATALLFAQKLSKRLQAEIRLTEGKTPFTTSGTYIREID